MYGDLETFSVTKFLDETYPTNDDTEAKQNLIDYLSLTLSKHPNVRKHEMDHFLDTITCRVRSISRLCLGLENLDDCPVDVVDDISKSIDRDINYLIQDKNEIIKISDGNFFLNLATLPDAVKFYKCLIDKHKIKFSLSRKQLETLYNECDFQSNFSNVLFTMSWLNILRVYNSNLIYFNNKVPLYF